MVVIILAVICICILRYVYCLIYNTIHRDDMYFDDESLQMKRWPKKKFTGKSKRLLTLMTMMLMMSSCSVSRPCTFTVYADKVEIVYIDNGEKEVIPIEPGETIHHAIKRNEKKKMKSNERLRSDEVGL